MNVQNQKLLINRSNSIHSSVLRQLMENVYQLICARWKQIAVVFRLRFWSFSKSRFQKNLNLIRRFFCLFHFSLAIHTMLLLDLRLHNILYVLVSLSDFFENTLPNIVEKIWNFPQVYTDSIRYPGNVLLEFLDIYFFGRDADRNVFNPFK